MAQKDGSEGKEKRSIQNEMTVRKNKQNKILQNEKPKRESKKKLIMVSEIQTD